MNILFYRSKRNSFLSKTLTYTTVVWWTMQSEVWAIEMSMAFVRNWKQSRCDVTPKVWNKWSMPKMGHGISSRVDLPGPFDRHTSNIIQILVWRMKASDIYPGPCNLWLKNICFFKLKIGLQVYTSDDECTYRKTKITDNLLPRTR